MRGRLRSVACDAPLTEHLEWRLPMSESHDTAKVKFRSIPNLEGYRFGSDGSVWSKRISIQRTKHEGSGSVSGIGKTWKLVNGTRAATGFTIVWINGKRELAHRMILIAFKGPCPPGHQCVHLNGNNSDNRIENLEWASIAERHRQRFTGKLLTDGTDREQAKNAIATSSRPVRKIKLRIPRYKKAVRLEVVPKDESDNQDGSVCCPFCARPWDIDGETWKTVKDFPMYQVSDFGRVRSWLNRRTYGAATKWRLLKPIHNNYSGYRRVFLSNGTKQSRKLFSVHRLILETFVGPCPDGMVCRHINGIPTDNRLSNLMWGSHQENNDDRRIHGTLPQGESHPMARLTADDVREIRRLKKLGMTRNELADMFHVSASQIKKICRGDTWSSIE